jgi:hypothetical protein
MELLLIITYELDTDFEHISKVAQQQTPPSSSFERSGIEDEEGQKSQPKGSLLVLFACDLQMAI